MLNRLPSAAIHVLGVHPEMHLSIAADGEELNLRISAKQRPAFVHALAHAAVTSSGPRVYEERCSA